MPYKVLNFFFFIIIFISLLSSFFTYSFYPNVVVINSNFLDLKYSNNEIISDPPKCFLNETLYDAKAIFEDKNYSNYINGTIYGFNKFLFKYFDNEKIKDLYIFNNLRMDFKERTLNLFSILDHYFQVTNDYPLASHNEWDEENFKLYIYPIKVKYDLFLNINNLKFDYRSAHMLYGSKINFSPNGNYVMSNNNKVATSLIPFENSYIFLKNLYSPCVNSYFEIINNRGQTRSLTLMIKLIIFFLFLLFYTLIIYYFNLFYNKLK